MFARRLVTSSKVFSAVPLVFTKAAVAASSKTFSPSMAFPTQKRGVANAAPSGCSMETAKKMPRHYCEFPNDVLLNAALNGDQEAREERLIRDIMVVKNCSWEDAQPEFKKIIDSNREGLFMATLPYKLGIGAALFMGFGSIPMIFELNTVLWFNEGWVTTDVPEDKDLETPLEVGSWAWNWMEPPLGQMSFFLLCMQYARSQLENLGAKPYTAWFLKKRAERVCAQFPDYCSHIVESFSVGDPLSSHDPQDTR